MSETAKRRLREAAESDSPIEALRELVAQVEALVALAREVVVIEGDVTFSQQLMCAVERGRALVELADEPRGDPSSCERAAQRCVQRHPRQMSLLLGLFFNLRSIEHRSAEQERILQDVKDEIDRLVPTHPLDEQEWGCVCSPRATRRRSTVETLCNICLGYV